MPSGYGSVIICTDPDPSINKQKIKKNLDFGRESGGFLKAGTSFLKRVTRRIFRIVSNFIEAIKNFFSPSKIRLSENYQCSQKR
jgi:hypothetical protein